MKVNVGDVVRIDWQDHFSSSDGWKSPEDDTGDLIEIICSSTGIVVKQDSRQIAIAQNWHDKPTENGLRKYADLMVIIKGCIRKITMIKRGEWK